MVWSIHAVNFEYHSLVHRSRRLSMVCIILYIISQFSDMVEGHTGRGRIWTVTAPGLHGVHAKSPIFPIFLPLLLQIVTNKWAGSHSSWMLVHYLNFCFILYSLYIFQLTLRKINSNKWTIKIDLSPFICNWSFLL